MDDAGALELLEPRGEDVGRNSREPVAQVGEAFGAGDEIADEQQCPALADELQGMGEPAELSVGPAGPGLDPRMFLASQIVLDVTQRSCNKQLPRQPACPSGGTSRGSPGQEGSGRLAHKGTA